MDITDWMASLPFVTVLAVGVGLYALKAMCARARWMPRRVANNGFQVFDTLTYAWVMVMVVISPTFGQGFYIPSESMEPSLMVHDRLVVERPPFWFRGPQRGEVLVFQAPPNAEPDGIQVDFIKRVIGLPGETLEVRAGRVFINGTPLDEPYTAEPSARDFGPIVVPKNHYFMMGDNRNNSADSRYWGPLDKKRIIGKAAFRFWPLTQFSALPAPHYSVPQKPQPALGWPFIVHRFGLPSS